MIRAAIELIAMALFLTVAIIWAAILAGVA